MTRKGMTKKEMGEALTKIIRKNENAEKLLFEAAGELQQKDVIISATRMYLVTLALALQECSGAKDLHLEFDDISANFTKYDIQTAFNDGETKSVTLTIKERENVEADNQDSACDQEEQF